MTTWVGYQISEQLSELSEPELRDTLRLAEQSIRAIRHTGCSELILIAPGKVPLDPRTAAIACRRELTCRFSQEGAA
jgi:hypothetical protein